MPEFLELLPPADALARLLAAWQPVPAARMEGIATEKALGRVTAVTVRASAPLPGFDRSTVDGYAVHARDTFGASAGLPAYLQLASECKMGERPSLPLHAGQAMLIHTGGMLPDGADGVVMLEEAQVSRPAELEVLRAVAVGENVIPLGADVRAGQVVIPAGKRLNAAEIGGLMALGELRVQVTAQPRVGILSSGDEVIHPAGAPSPGQVRDVNSYSLSALVEGWGGRAVRYGIFPDRLEALSAALGRALQECDLAVITAGSSASVRDLTAQAIAAHAPPGVVVHGVQVRPGKPTLLGVCAGKPVIGLPGNPVSAMVIARLFVRPLLHRLLGMAEAAAEMGISAQLTANVPSKAGREDWLPVRLTRAGGQTLAEPIFFQSNLIFTLAQADGLIRIEADTTGLEAGCRVEVFGWGE